MPDEGGVSGEGRDALKKKRGTYAKGGAEDHRVCSGLLVHASVSAQRRCRQGTGRGS